jgi:hypothetical protein
MHKDKREFDQGLPFFPILRQYDTGQSFGNPFPAFHHHHANDAE